MTLRLALLGSLAAVPLTARQPMTPRDSALHVLNRLAYGPTPGLLDQVVREGALRWIDRQLAFDRVDDPALGRTLEGYALLQHSPDELLRTFLQLQQQRRLQRRDAAALPDSMMTPPQREQRLSPEAREFRRLNAELPELVVVRATQSSRQLGEILADFWANHFNVFVGKALDRVYLPSHIEQAIRPHALGSFEELLLATATSPAMLVYLDNAESVAPGSQPLGLLRPRLAAQRRPTGINENYARELMELHTLGVDGGYTQHDVTEIARILTGWSIYPPQRGGGGFVFNDWAHDRGAKTVLGINFPAGKGEDEGIKLLKLLANHPSTMHFVSGKLCARFVSDTPPDGCIDDAVRAWEHSKGNIREVVRAILHSPDFWAAGNVDNKVKTPLEFVASAVRAVGATVDTTPRLAFAVARLGEPLYEHVAPNGYGERQEDWVNSGALLNRMNFGIALAANRLPGVTVDLDAILSIEQAADPDRLVSSVNELILGGKLSAQTRKVILEQLSGITDPAQARALAVGLAIGGPEFQRQ